MLINCPECNREVSDKAITCPHCGYVLKVSSTPPPASPAPSLESKAQEKVEPSGTVKLVTFGIMVVIALLLWKGCGAMLESGAESGKKCDAENARVAAEKFVTDKLKSPSSASFSWEPKMSNTSDERWIEVSWVESQNAFGATVRTKFYAVVICKGDGNWTLENLVIE